MKHSSVGSRNNYHNEAFREGLTSEKKHDRVRGNKVVSNLVEELLSPAANAPREPWLVDQFTNINKDHSWA